MKLSKPAITYIGISTLIALIAKPAYDEASVWVVMFAGTAGSLLLFLQAIPDIYYQDLSLGNQICWETFGVASFAFILWLAGGVLVYLVGKKGVKSIFTFFLILGWICGSIYNVFWFAIRSL